MSADEQAMGVLRWKGARERASQREEASEQMRREHVHRAAGAETAAELCRRVWLVAEVPMVGREGCGRVSGILGEWLAGIDARCESWAGAPGLHGRYRRAACTAPPTHSRAAGGRGVAVVCVWRACGL